MFWQDEAYPLDEQCFLKSEQDDSLGSKKEVRTICFDFFSYFVCIKYM